MGCERSEFWKDLIGKPDVVLDQVFITANFVALLIKVISSKSDIAELEEKHRLCNLSDSAPHPV